MKTKLLTVALILSLLSTAFAYQSRPQGFEYKVVNAASDKKLNELGAEGWELVATSDYGSITTCYMKRAKQ